jgi:hypothetical protein
MKRTFPTIGFALFGLMAGLPLPGTHLLAQESPSETGLPGSPLALLDEPITNLGVVAGDPAQEFHRVVTPFALPSGEVAVPLADDREIRIFAPDGEYLRTLGGRGEGPGEFLDLDQAWIRGDTIEAFDGRTRRITRFFPDDSVTTVRLQPVLSAQAVVPGGPGPGWILSGVASAEFGGRDDMVVHSFGPDGTYRGEIAHTLGMARFRTRLLTGPDPISPKAVFAAGAGAVYFGETLTPAVTAVNESGDTLSHLTWTPENTHDPNEAFGIVVATARDQEGPERAVELQAQLEAFPVRDRVSVFWGLLVDELGFLWIRPFDPSEHALYLGGFSGVGMGGRWRVFSAEGAEVDSVVFPSRFEPTHITRDRIVGIHRDELGVESVQAFPLQRTG